MNRQKPQAPQENIAELKVMVMEDVRNLVTCCTVLLNNCCTHPFNLDWQVTGGFGAPPAQGQVLGGAGDGRDPGRVRRGCTGAGLGH